MKFPILSFKSFMVSMTFFLSFSFAMHLAHSQTQPLTNSQSEINVRYFIGSVDVVISSRPIKKVQTPCYVQIENFSGQNLNSEINVQAYLTLEHLSDGADADQDGFVWLHIENRKATLINTNNRPPLYRYRATEPVSVELIRDLNVILDTSFQPLSFGVQYWHITHPDEVICNQLIEQKTEDEIKNFQDNTSHIFNSNNSTFED